MGELPLNNITVFVADKQFLQNISTLCDCILLFRTLEDKIKYDHFGGIIIPVLRD